MTTRSDIVECARKFLGVRYHHQGRNGFGLDCAGLVISVAKELELSDFDMKVYPRVPGGGMLRANLNDNMDLVADYQIGDVLLLRFDVEPQHLAIVTDCGIIHAYAQARKVVEHSLDAVWISRIVSAYSFRGLDG